MPSEKTLTRSILTLAWPAVATNVTTPLLSLVDVAVVGHIGNSVYIAAIAVGATMFNMLYWLFGFLRMGTSGMTAQAYGGDDFPEAIRVLVRALTIAAVSGLLLIAASSWLGVWILNFIDADGAAREPAQTYFSIAILGAPGVLVTYALSGWFLGMQNARPILWMALTANTLNIILNVFFVFACGWQIAGVGAATAISQWISAGVGIYLIRLRIRQYAIAGWREGVMQFQALKKFFRINSDIFLRTLCLVAVTVWFTHAGAMLGVDTLSANALLMQLFMLFSYFMDGFAFAGEALAGRFKGAHDINSLRSMIRVLTKTGLLLSAIVTLTYFFSGEAILGLLTDDGRIISIASDYKLWAVAIPFAGFMSFLWDGVFVGLTRTRGMLVSMAVSMVVFYTIYFSLVNKWGNDALWLAFLSYLLTRGLVLTVLFRKTRI